ncbi:MAG: hypothetical protein JEZ11_08255 [Desulfobacterales bacterium]|nr:hypothetical protein [Desulfobacterales bacterium]
MKDMAMPDLSGKIVLLYLEHRDHETTIEAPVFEEHSGRLFLVGRVPTGGSQNDWLGGLKVYIAWDQIQEIVIFNSLDDYYDRMAVAWNDNVMH